MAKLHRYNLDDVKADALGHWSPIIERVAGVGDDHLSTVHGPCPKCGGTDRWRVFDDFEQTGGAICNQCGKFGDGVAVVMWMLGVPFLEAVRRVAEFLGTAPEGTTRGKGSGGYTPPKVNGSAASHKPAGGSPKRNDDPPADPPEFRTLKFLPPVPTDGVGFAMWCRTKPGMNVEQLQQMGARFRGTATATP